jgi:hypothetical protein
MYGKVLKELAFLSDGDWILKRGDELMGDAVGGTPKKVNQILDMAQVLSIAASSAQFLYTEESRLVCIISGRSTIGEASKERLMVRQTEDPAKANGVVHQGPKSERLGVGRVIKGSQQV